MPPTKNLRRLACGLAVAATGLATTICVASAAEPTHLPFQTHAAFFSAESKQARTIDPQAFVKDEAAPTATGPQGIVHAAGFRPALIGSDPMSSPVFAADGKALGFTLGQWLGATGDVSLTPNEKGGIAIVIDARGLRPNARYSLFENHFDQKPVGFTPLDGAGTANSFTTDANGGAHVTVQAPGPLTHDNAVLVILDNDGVTYGTERGPIGLTAQHQLIARPPAP